MFVQDFQPAMFGRTGNEVLGSARRRPQSSTQDGHSARGLPPLQASMSPMATMAPMSPMAPVELSGRRKAAVKKAFKRLDRMGSGAVPLDEAMQTFAANPMSNPGAQQDLRAQLGRLSTPGPGGRQLLSLAAFSSYYQGVSASIPRDGDFERILQAEWGYSEVSDILAGMQRQFISVGLASVFQDHSRPCVELGLKDFEACLNRAGLHPRPDDLQRVFGAFSGAGGLRLDDFRDQILAPRPETPVPKMRDLVIPAAAPPGGLPTSPVGQPPAPQLPGQPDQSSGPPPGDEDLDGALQQMEAELHKLRRKKTDADAAGPSPPSGHPGAPAGGTGGAPHHHELPEGPINDGDLDAALSRMETRIHHIKSHKAIAKQSQPPPAAPPVDMPHWEHHKYGHHKVTEPAWKPDAQVTDMAGHQHSSAEYGYSNYGAGSHSHHLAHFHLNDYHGLAHHSFGAQEYHRQDYGDKAHHGHWVPHLHGIGTEGHHGEHSYKADEYNKNTIGKEGHHSHWVPHLHGLGSTAPHPGQ